MILYAIIAVAVIVIVLVIFVATRPAEYRITRTVAMAAPAAVVFAQVDDFHKWAAWSPWEKIDPAFKKTFEGAAAGTGAIYSWVGNSKVGAGRMTIMESRPGEFIRIKLEFLKPFKATNNTEYTFKSEGSKTVVTWSMTGHNNFIFKAARLFMNMDKMLGSQFEQGLAQMKSVSEAAGWRQA